MENIDELDINLDELDQVDANADKKLQVRNRYQQLANDKRQLAQEKDAEAKARAEAEAKALEAEKKVEFYKNFNQITSKYPEATNFQDQILERVSKGLDMEEATLGLLAKEGKLQAPPPPQGEPLRPEGGSAINSLQGPKETSDMNENEMLDSLRELEQSGELQKTLRSGLRIG